jgi:hypothetical protein
MLHEYVTVMSLSFYHWHCTCTGPIVKDVASSRNEYQVYFLGVKAAGA